MINFLISLFGSAICSFLIIRYNNLHAHFTSDSDFSKPQKFHLLASPRIGGISIMIGLILALVFGLNISNISIGHILLLCSTPVFISGLFEDVTKTLSIRARFLFALVSSALAVQLLPAYIVKLDFIFFDFLFAIPFFGLLFSIFSITGLINAYNIIDGFHGLSSSLGIFALLAITYVCFQVNDLSIGYLSICIVGGILGFFVFNFPRGLIFLGDGGAYLIGFCVGALSILVIQRNPQISPVFALLISSYPIIETLFTIYRRKFFKRGNPSHADGLHLHSLIYRRITKLDRVNYLSLSPNARVTPHVWIIALTGIVPAVLSWHSTYILTGTFLLVTLLYLYMYIKIVRFKTPKWLNWKY